MSSAPSFNFANGLIENMLLNVPIAGCLDETACNYNPNATETDDSCIYPAENYNCDGICIAEIDCAGVCDGSAVEDECSVCNGDGIADGACDCDGNVDDECGVCGGSGLDCAGGCDGLVVDECDICGGGETNANNCLGIYNDFTVANQFQIQRFYPNPFNPVLNININLAWAGMTQVNILDIAGAHIETLHSGFLKSGSHELSWHAESMPSGLYFISLKLGDKSLTEKVVLLK